ncbi:ATP-binding protein [Nonomuraea sp. NPDC050022]|uniref:ATP-binding protein n=1 Tax=unclassified Nonomuraea TaxID=2593643 RepID=UPI0033E59D15
MNQNSGSALMTESTLWQDDPGDRVMPWDSHTPVWDRLKAGIRRLGELVTGSGHLSGMEVASWSLSPGMSSVPEARRLTRARLAAWGLDELAEVAELLVSELVTNALRHAPGPHRFTLYASDGLLRGEVEDAGTAPLCLHQATPGDEHGRGLDLIDLLACCWGSESAPSGKTVWFELSADCAAKSDGFSPSPHKSAHHR